LVRAVGRYLVARAGVSLGAIFARLGLIDLKRAPAELGAVESLNCRRAFFFGLHFDKPEPARAASFAIFNQRDVFDCARFREQCLQIATRRIEREITNIKFHRHFFFYLFPFGTNRSFRSFPICQGLHDPEERSLGFLTGLSCGIQLIWKSARGAEEQSKLDSVLHHHTLTVAICQTQDIFCLDNMRRPH